MRRGNDRRILSHGGNDHCDPFNEGLAIGGRGTNLFGDVVADLRPDRLRVHQEVDEVAVAEVAWNSPRGGVRLDEVTEVAQVVQLAPDRRRAEVQEVAADERLGTDRNGALGEFVHHGLEDSSFSGFH